jgi:hypothetical protein
VPLQPQVSRVDSLEDPNIFFRKTLRNEVSPQKKYKSLLSHDRNRKVDGRIRVYFFES